LLDTAAFTQIAHSRAMVFPAFRCPVKLTKHNDGDIKFSCQRLEVSRYFGDFLLA
jgi:hypothetical protein